MHIKQFVLIPLLYPYFSGIFMHTQLLQCLPKLCVLLRLRSIIFCGICHSDIHHVRNNRGREGYPMVPGHEIVGKVFSINGHSLFIAARKWASRGYMDLDLEDYPGNALIQEVQENQVKSAPVSMGLFV
ncbi:hypothetical protein V1517DRAFT_332903 [Lipomyces orientalis]|uniref:Uncharacterized protein n=1 Tax=Lipomyces orientalis TaxID=1233043 RepID=A0ACC3TDZ2_9ASCO